MDRDTIFQPPPPYRQVVTVLARRIAEGVYPPGTKLPSEAQLRHEFGITRYTARAAMSALQERGLVESRQGVGTVVLVPPPAPFFDVPQTITIHHPGGVIRTGPHGDMDATQVEPPAITRIRLAEDTAKALHLDPQAAAFQVDRLLGCPDLNGKEMRAGHRLVLPFAMLADVLNLSIDPEDTPARIYTALHAAGQRLSWQETVTARTATPDERTTLGAPNGVPILVATRTTMGTTGAPLLLEELRISAVARLAYGITPAHSDAPV
ncbi:GntR family transcriptional regulator [Streptomyces sp. 71268]|uniref:GntR family transcriptional regulator n=1 Tax=Streptomyces sp. 71268 TaxID=3002640 RepID=UPI0023F85D64|nr:GntR family transcriptional regulator [Streptomyces sp. 71268]WEV25650.1 GntR family transcriptional regulator [Streptomyces sp. 71268]